MLMVTSLFQSKIKQYHQSRYKIKHMFQWNQHKWNKFKNLNQLYQKSMEKLKLLRLKMLLTFQLQLFQKYSDLFSKTKKLLRKFQIMQLMLSMSMERIMFQSTIKLLSQLLLESKNMFQYIKLQLTKLIN